jgi:hypothetical protein
MPRKPLALDNMVDFLAAEDEFWRRTYHDQRLWHAKKRDTTVAQERYRSKRMHLSHYHDRSKDTDKRSQSLNFFDLTWEGEEEEANDGDERGDETVPDSSLLLASLFANGRKENNQWRKESDDEEDDVIDLVFVGGTTANTTTKSNPILHSRRASSVPPSDRRRTYPLCRRHLVFSDKCSLKTCKKCCASNTKYCKIYSHRQSKIGAPQPYEQNSLATKLNSSLTSLPPPQPNPAICAGVLETIQATICDKHSVYISYLGGTKGNQPRKIDPRMLKVGKEGQFVEAHCHVTNESRTFYLHKIMRIEDHNWATDSTITACNLFTRGNRIYLVLFASF